MNVVAVDPEQRLAVLAADDFMGGPELVDDGLGLVHAWKWCRMRLESKDNIEAHPDQC